MKNSIENRKTTALKQKYDAVIVPKLKESLALKNIMEVPKVAKVVINVGVKEAVGDSKALLSVAKIVEAISGQIPLKTKARKSIAGFKIREGMNLGVCVTLRGLKMYAFLEKLLNLALPKVRDFQGVPTKLDGRGNYNLGIKEWNIFPEVDTIAESSHGLNITIQTTAKNDAHGFALLKELGMPFRKNQK